MRQTTSGPIGGCLKNDGLSARRTLSLLKAKTAKSATTSQGSIGEQNATQNPSG